MCDSTRRSIVEILAEREALNYTEIMTTLSITNTGRLKYHLKSLGDLITKDDESRYRLTERGRIAANMLKTFPERVSKAGINNGLTLKNTLSIVLMFVGVVAVAGVTFIEVVLFRATVVPIFFQLLASFLFAIGLGLIVVGVLVYKNRILH
jgi:predicted transcriptional regulator